MIGLGAVNTQALEAQLSAAYKQLHGTAASLGQLRQGYERTRDPRYLDSIRAMLPFYQTAMERYAGVAAQLGREERPAEFALTLDRTSDWLAQQGRTVVEGVTGTIGILPTLAKNLTNPIVLISIAAAAIVIFGGVKFGRGR